MITLKRIALRETIFDAHKHCIARRFVAENSENLFGQSRLIKIDRHFNRIEPIIDIGADFGGMQIKRA